jgi:PTS system mannose-specific IIA component
MSQSKPLIGLVLVTHGRLALELVAAMEHVVGPQTQVATVCIGPEDDMEQRRADIVKAVETVNAGSGVVVLTDMFGGTPSNLAISIMETAPVEVIAGVNLPMLIKLASVRSTDTLQNAAVAAQDAGRKYINVASALLSQEKQKTKKAN